MQGHRGLLAGIAACAATAVCGCASNSNFYSARSLGQGNSQAFVAVSNITTKSDTIPIIEKIPDFTFVEFGAAVGLTNRLDVGIKYTFPTAAFLDARYMLIGEGRTTGAFLAAGARAGYTAFPTQQGDSTDNNRIEIAVPVYLSYFPLEWLGISLIPTYSGRVFVGSQSTYENLVGGNVNIRAGRKLGVVVEFAYFRNLRWNWDELQFGGGVLFPVPNPFSSGK